MMVERLSAKVAFVARPQFSNAVRQSRAIQVSGTLAWLLAIDFQSGHDTLAKLPDPLLYNSALFKRHGMLCPACLSCSIAVGFAQADRALRAWLYR